MIRNTAPLLLTLALLVPLAVAQAGEKDLAPPKDAPVELWRGELLDLALQSAGKLPLVPHARNRSRIQEVAVEACLQLDQPQRALAGIEEIVSWRRGTGYADYALWCVEHGAMGDVPRSLELAQQVADQPPGEDAQDWQRNRIRGRIAAVHVRLGQAAEAERFGAGVEAADAVDLQAARTATVAADGFEAAVTALDAQLATTDFDTIRNALAAFAQLHDRFYADAERRALAEERIRAGGEKLPVQVRIDLGLELSGNAARHAEPAHALELLGEAQALADEAQWTTIGRVTILGRLALARAEAGDKERARSQATEALTLFNTERERIVDIERAAGLRAVAEALQAAGDTPASLAVYRLAVEEGVANPNSRPRVDDLVATCCSMARRGVQPDEALWKRLHAIADGLGDPW